MQNILEYLKWRGDITFRQQTFCEADYLVFSQLAYMPFGGVVPALFQAGTTVKTAAEAVLNRLLDKKDNSLLDWEENIRFLRRLLNSPRFAELSICGFTEIFSKQEEEQFSAVSFLVPEETSPEGLSLAIAFRGTDSTLVGWKEDFNMAFSDAVPSQLDAVKYIEKAADSFPAGNIHVCGHSKGGNLAVYGSAFCNRQVQDRIAAVRSLDGPGFLPEVIQREAFQRILPRTETVVPGSSVVGILLEHAESFVVVRSYASSSPYQHNPFTWVIDRCGYMTVESITKSSQYLDETLSRWVADMTPAMRETLINGLFQIVEQTGAEDVRDIFNGKNLLIMLRALRTMEPGTAKVIGEAVSLFQKAAGKTLPGFMERLRGDENETL